MLAQKSDINFLVDMRIAYIADDQGSVKSDDMIKLRKNLPRYFENHLNKDIFAFIEREENQVVSMVLLLIIEKPSNPHFINGKIGEVLSVYTVPEYRRRGIAGKLIDKLIQFSKNKELDYIELDATNEGYPLYKKLGFRDYENTYKPMRYILHE